MRFALNTAIASGDTETPRTMRAHTAARHVHTRRAPFSVPSRVKGHRWICEFMMSANGSFFFDDKIYDTVQCNW